MPFGKPDIYQLCLQTSMVEEGKQFLEERYERNAELSYLNARYHDLKLGMFV